VSVQDILQRSEQRGGTAQHTLDRIESMALEMKRILNQGEHRLPDKRPLDGKATPKIEVTHVTFVLNSVKLSKTSQEILDRDLRGYGADSRFLVVGFADKTGSPAKNKVLSARRAEAVARWMIATQGITSSQISYSGGGESDAYTQQGDRGSNRRAVIYVLQGQ
jgi:outer membrane protein OmpA-like peptidoglycan-associated protein